MNTILKNSTTPQEQLFTPQDIALSFSDTEEGAAAQSTVAWGMVVLNFRFGWTGKTTPAKDMKSATFMAREQFGYKRDNSGALQFNSAGKKIKRTAVYDKLSVAGELAAFLHGKRLDLFNLMHESAVKGDGDAMADAVEQAAQALVEQAGGNSFDALREYLTTGKRKEQTEQEKIEQAQKLAEQDAAKKAKEAEEAAKVEQTRRADTINSLSLLELLSRLESLTNDELQAVAQRARDIVAMRAIDAELDTPQQVEQAAAA